MKKVRVRYQMRRAVKLFGWRKWVSFNIKRTIFNSSLSKPKLDKNEESVIYTRRNSLKKYLCQLSNSWNFPFDGLVTSFLRGSEVSSSSMKDKDANSNFLLLDKGIGGFASKLHLILILGTHESLKLNNNWLGFTMTHTARKCPCK